MARASSGSRSSIRPIEPLMSANSAVMVLRSPSRFSGMGVSANRIRGSSDFVVVLEGVPRAAPHSPQNFSAGSKAAPHRGHLPESAEPHWVQKFRPSRLSAPHFKQRIASSPNWLARRSTLSPFSGPSQRLYSGPREARYRRHPDFPTQKPHGTIAPPAARSRHDEIPCLSRITKAAINFKPWSR